MRLELTDAQRATISRLLPEPKAKLTGVYPWANDEDVMEGMLRALRNGARWRDLGPIPRVCEVLSSAWSVGAGRSPALVVAGVPERSR